MLHKICKTGSTLIFVFVMLFAMLFVVPPLFGYHQYVVLSGSMEPNLSVGAIVYEKAFEKEQIKIGDVVTYSLSGGTLVTHRVVSVDQEKKTIKTKGDANEHIDAGDIPFENVTGVCVFSLPYLGYVSAYAKTPLGIAVMIAILMVFFTLNAVEKYSVSMVKA